MLVRGAVHLAPRGAALYAHGLLLRVHLDLSHRRKVDDKTVVADSEAARVVASAPNRDQHALPAREVDRSGHVFCVRTARDRPGRRSIMAL